jgi:hypothetical protein
MFKVNELSNLDSTTINAKEVCRILTSKKKYMILIDSNVHLTNDYIRFITVKYPEIPYDEITIFRLNY